MKSFCQGFCARFHLHLIWCHIQMGSSDPKNGRRVVVTKKNDPAGTAKKMTLLSLRMNKSELCYHTGYGGVRDALFMIWFPARALISASMVRDQAHGSYGRLHFTI
jgi:hypothetical protein